MLKNLVTLNNVGLYKTGITPDPIPFKSRTVIFANNGCGKSTLTAVLRAASENDDDAIAERKRKEASENPKICITHSAGAARYVEGHWVGTSPKIKVFDSEFIEANVHSANVARTAQKSSLARIALGETAIDKRDDLARIETKLSEIKNELRNAESEINKVMPPGFDIARFQGLPKITDVEASITECQTRLSACRRRDAILSRPMPPLFDLTMPDPDETIEALQSATEMHQLAVAARVVAKMASLDDPARRAWIHEGIKYLSGDLCPFCAQPAATSPTIPGYRAIFNDEFEQTTSQIRDIKTEIVSQFDGLQSRVADCFNLVDRSTLQWKEDVPTSVAPIPHADEIAGKLNDALNLLVELCDELLDNPHRTPNYADIKSTYCDIQSEFNFIISKLNTEVSSMRAAIHEFTGRLTDADTDRNEALLAELQASRIRHSDEGVHAMTAYEANQRTLSNLTEQRKAAMVAYKSAAETTFTKYVDRTNLRLAHLGARFTLEDAKNNFTGGSFRGDYMIRVGNTNLKTTERSSTFRTALSEGDKRTLGFAFFIESVLALPDIQEHTIIFDDPMTSLDRPRRFETINAILEVAERTQIVVLAHDDTFLREFYESSVRRNTEGCTPVAYAINKYQNMEAEIVKVDLSDILETEYQRNYRLLMRFHGADRGVNPIDAAKALRPVFEGYLHRMFPAELPEGKMLEQCIQTIEGSGADEAISSLKPFTSELRHLKDYSNSFHHDGSHAARTNVQVDELAAQLGVLLKFMRAVPKEF
ncbi:AAA family ATPase [Actinomyces haliotis]|uniref:AAA family ATPase n=1 Tax=Actinomyces haliotis TaxID=1280843 RepID=UPI00188E62ED|nr:AAA family ATPase [Actinomyces haliotis]